MHNPEPQCAVMERPLLADIVAKVFLGRLTKILRASDALSARRRVGTISFHPKSITGLPSSAEKRRSSKEVQRSTLARFSGLSDFRLLQQYRHFSDLTCRADKVRCWEQNGPLGRASGLPRTDFPPNVGRERGLLHRNRRSHPFLIPGFRRRVIV
jgi:hypothetical protein